MSISSLQRPEDEVPIDEGTKRPLRQFGESSLEDELRRFGAFAPQLSSDGSLSSSLTQALLVPAYLTAFQLGFVGGVIAGSRERIRAWYDDLENTVHELAKFLEHRGVLQVAVLGGASLYEFFGVKFDPRHPGTLSPEVKQALQRLEIIRELAPVFRSLDALNDEAKTKSLLEMLQLAAEDLVESLRSATQDWLDDFFRRTDPVAKGEMLGRFLGEAIVELLRAFVEPPALSVAELVARLGLSDSELSELIRDEVVR